MRLACAVVLSAWLVHARVCAHAGPQIRTVLLADKSAVLVGNRGLMFGEPGGARWQLMCNEALDVTTSELPDVVAVADGRILAATSHGLLATRDRGCSWQGVEPFGELATPSLTQHPQHPEQLYLTVYGPGQSGLRVSHDGGQHWESLLMAADGDYLRFVQIAPSRPERLYVRKLALVDMRYEYSTLRSDDAGKTWSSSTVPLEMRETDFVLLGVSPTDPELLIAKAEGANPSAVPERLLVSRDGGKTFESPLGLLSLRAVAFSRDGETMWIGSDEGLHRSRDGGRSFERVGPAELVSCLKETDGELLVCGYFHGGSAGMPGIGALAEGTDTAERWMALTDVVEPLACDAAAPTSITCAPWWGDWYREILSGDASALAAGSGASAAVGGAGGAVAGSAAEVAGNPAAVGGAASGSDVSPRDGGCSVSLDARRSATPTWLALALLMRRHRRRRAQASA